MKRTISRILAAVLTLCLVVTVLLPAVALKSSAEASLFKRYNIMMVIDGSGSLETASKTDPDRMRYELIGDLLGVLENDGHNIGAIVFSGNAGQSAADADMEKGIMLNTGMLSLDKMSPDGSPVKSYIENKIKEAGYDHTRNGTTDIGTALLVAERELQKTQMQNGLESLVFLFTDGVTDLKTTEQMQKSKNNMDLATREMNQNGIRLMGAYLNKDGKLSSEEMKSIVCAANGITESSPEFAVSYVELTNAADCHDAVNIILKFLGYVDWDDDDDDDDVDIHIESFEEKFTIPGIGVQEMNIRLYSPKGETLPDMEVEMVQPDGTVLKGMTLNAISRKSRTFQIYKLVAPMAGEWTIRVTMPEGNDVECAYAPILSVLVDAQISTIPDVAAFHGNMDATFIGTLAQNGTTVTDAAAYREYSCQLMIQNRITGEKKDPIDIPNNNTGKFEHTMRLDEYGEFEAYIVFTCDKLRVVSPTISYKIENTPPTTQSPAKFFTISGLFMSKTKQVDLTKYINDREDGTNLTIAVKSATCSNDGYTLNGANLEIVKKHIGKDTIELTVTDSAGEAATLQIQLHDYNVTIWFVLLFLLILIFILIIIFICILLRNKIRPKGELTVSFDLEVEGRIEPVVLTLAVPNVNAPSNTNLKKLMHAALLDDGQRLDCGLTSTEIRTALRKVWDELSDVSIYKEVKRKGKKKEGAIGVKYGKKKKVLYDSAFTIYVEKQEFTLEFLLERDDDDPFSDGLGDDPMTSGGGGNDPFSDLFN